MARPALWLCSLLLWLGACAGPWTGQIAPPEVSLAGLSFAKAGLLEQALTVRLKVRNPNAFAVPVNALRFGLALNGGSFADGRTAAAFTLPSQGESVVPITIAIPTTNLLQRVAALGTGRRLDYRLTGEAELGQLFSIAIPFVREGQLALPAVPGWNEPRS